MGFREVASLDADVTTALGGKNKKTGKPNPTKAEGYYLGSRKVDSKKSKDGKAYIHFLQTSKGNLGVWGKTDLDRKLTTIAPGTMVRVSFDKMVPTPNGDMYKFKVEADPDNTIEVADFSDSAPSDTEETTDDVETYAAQDEAEYEQKEVLEEDEEEAQAQAAAQRRASVLSKLNKSKTAVKTK